MQVNYVINGTRFPSCFQVLFLDHPRRDIRDTSRYKPFRQLMGGRTPSLKKLTSALLGVAVQEGEHNSVSKLVFSQVEWFVNYLQYSLDRKFFLIDTCRFFSCFLFKSSMPSSFAIRFFS